VFHPGKGDDCTKNQNGMEIHNKVKENELANKYQILQTFGTD
jgi:hypothetical protein